MAAGGEKETLPNPVKLIHDLAEAYQASQILFFANDAGLFLFLNNPHTIEDAAAQFGWSVRGARIVMHALEGLGLLTENNGVYRNSAAAGQCLVPGAPEYRGGFVRHMARTAEAWKRLEQSVRTGKGVYAGRHKTRSAEWRDYADALAELETHSAQELLASVDFSPFHALLELGAGPGVYAVRLLEKYPALRMTLIDSPAMLARARRAAADAGVADRCSFLSGDFMAEDIPGRYDAILISNVVHGLPAAAIPGLFQRCYAALAPGGTLLLRDFLRGADGQDPLFTRLFALQMLLHTDGGEPPELHEIAACAARAGFLPGQCIPLGSKSRLWRAERPASRPR